MNSLTAFVTLMAAISVASERVIEILKGMVPPLAKGLQGAAEGTDRRTPRLRRKVSPVRGAQHESRPH